MPTGERAAAFNLLVRDELMYALSVEKSFRSARAECCDWTVTVREGKGGAGIMMGGPNCTGPHLQPLASWVCWRCPLHDLVTCFQRGIPPF